jgi:TonB family protein
MSSANALSTPTQSRRRYHARRRIDGLIYVDFGPDNGAILIDLGEGGLGFQSVVPVSVDHAILLKFKVPGDTNPVEGYAEVAWLNESGKGGGLRFVELSSDARAQIRGFAGELSAPEPATLEAANGSELPSAATETAIEAASAEATDSSPAPEAVNSNTSPDTSHNTSDDAPAQISQTFTGADNTQPPSPQIDDVLRVAEAAQEHIPAAEDPWPGQSLLAQFLAGLRAELATAEPPAAQLEAAPPPDAISATPAANSASPVPEFAVETSAAESSEPLAMDSESPLPVTSISVAQEVDSAASRADESVNAAVPEEFVFVATSEIANATAAPEPAPSLQSSSEVAALPQTAAVSDVSAKRAGVERTNDFTPKMPQPIAAPSAKPSRPQSSDTRNSDAKNFAQPPKRQRKSAPSKPEASVGSAYRQDSAARGSFTRQSAKPAFAGSEWENLLDAPQDDLPPQATFASQALKVGIGAAAGVCLLLILVFAVPALRALVQTTANARSGASNLANAPAFQVEVADLNNRRWILKSGGDAGSPFGDTSSRRDASSATSNTSRKDSAKSSRSDDSADSSEAVTAPEPKPAKPVQLALARPVAKAVPQPADAPAAQLVAPSIFDGITPPIGSLTDRLPAGGPDMPGIVPPASPAAGGRASTLQAAVLQQRVPPVYPSLALQAKVQGEVSVNATIGKDGIPKDLKLVKGDARLVDAAFAAIRQWRYRPATLGGIPIETQTVVNVTFELK